MMRFSIYKNLFSKEAAGEIFADQFVRAVREGIYHETVEKYRMLRQEGRKDDMAALKKNAPAVTFCGVCKKGRYFEMTSERTGWAMFDFDGLEMQQIKPVREVLQVCPWVVMVFVTISGAGLRAVVNIGMVEKDDYAGVYMAVAGKLERLTGAKTDSQCKDFARLSVVSYDPDIYYNPDAEVFPYVKNKGMKAVATDPGGNGPDVDSLVDRFFSRNAYVEGSRHDTLLKLGRYLRWCRVGRWQLDRAVDRVCAFATGNGMKEKEVRDTITWAYDNSKERSYSPQGSGGPHGHYKGFGKAASAGMECNASAGKGDDDGEDEESIAGKYCSNIPDSVYEVLPESLKKLLMLAKDRTERDILLLSSLGMMSGIFYNLRTMYGNRMYSPHLYVVVIAPPGSGKGLASLAMKLGVKIDKKLAQRYAIEKSVYDKKLMEWELEQKLALKEKRLPNIELCPEMPIRCILVLPPNTSKSQFMLNMRDVGIKGITIASSEIEALAMSLATDYGKHLPELRMAFHHETIGQNYKVDKEPVIIESPRVAMVIAGTLKQYMDFVTNTEDGMSSRFATFLSWQRGGWKSQSPLEGNGDIDADKLVDELGEKLKNFYFEEEGNLIQINFTEAQWKRHKERFEELLAVVMAECVEGTEAVVMRGGLIAIRFAMVLCGVRMMEAGWKTRSYTCSDEDFDAALDIETNCIKHAIHLATMYRNENHRRKMRAFFQKLAILESMDPVFTYSEFVNRGMEWGFSESSVKRALKKYISTGIVVKENGRYRKVKNINMDLYRAANCYDEL